MPKGMYFSALQLVGGFFIIYFFVFAVKSIPFGNQKN